MAINTNTVEANLTTKLNATTATTDAKEFLLLGKAVEALTPSVTVQDVIDQGDTEIARVTTEGTTQVAAVQAAAAGYAPLTGATFTGGITGTTGTFSGALSATDLTLSGNLTVSGTTTTINTATLDVADLNITIADGAADSAAADGAGITIEGAGVNFQYSDSGKHMSLNTGLSVEEVKEKCELGTSTTGAFNINAVTGSVVYYQNNQTANRTINFRGDASTTLDSIMSVGQSMTFAVLMAQGSTAYYLNAYQIDGTAVTPKWQGGAPTGGNASSIDVYTFTIIKTAANTFTVLASQAAYE